MNLSYGWLDGIFGALRCANCGAVYAHEDVTIAGNRDDYWFLRCTCHTCGTQGVGVVILKQIELALPSGSRAEEAFIELSTRCANCGAIYSRGDVRLVGNRDDYWFLRCTCHTCGTQGVGVVLVKEKIIALLPIQPTEHTLTVDDVLEAHEALKSYHGDIHGLFAKKKDQGK